MNARRLLGVALVAASAASVPSFGHAWPDDVPITTLAQRRGRLGYRYTTNMNLHATSGSAA